MALPRVEVEVTADTRQAEAGLDRVGAAAIKAGNQTRVAATGMSRLGQTFQNNGFAISNAANQFSDLAVQIGMGVPATRALSQQLPQLTAFMGPLANVIGVASGVLIGLAGNFLLAGDGARTFQDDLDALEESTKGLRDELFLLQQGLDNLAQVAILREIQSIQEEIAANEARVTELREKGGNQAIRQRRAVEATLEVDRARLAELQKQLEENKSLTDEIETAKEEAEKLASIEFGNIERAVSSAQLLAKSLGISVEAAQRLMSISGGTSSVDPTVSGFEALDPRSGSAASVLNRGSAAGNAKTNIAGLGIASVVAGGGASTPLEILDEELTAQEQRMKEHFERIEGLYTGGLSDQLGAYGNYFSNLVSMTGSNNKRLLALGKAFQAGQSLVDAWGAYTKVLNDPSFVGRPWARVAAAAQVLSAGLGAVSAIKGVTEGGGGGGGAGLASAGAAAQFSAPQASRNVAIQITGGDMFDRGQVVELINRINEAQEDGAIVRLVQ